MDGYAFGWFKRRRFLVIWLLSAFLFWKDHGYRTWELAWIKRWMDGCIPVDYTQDRKSRIAYREKL